MHPTLFLWFILLNGREISFLSNVHQLLLIFVHFQNDTDLVQVDLSGNPTTAKEASYIGELLKTNKFITHLVSAEMSCICIADPKNQIVRSVCGYCTLQSANQWSMTEMLSWL